MDTIPTPAPTGRRRRLTHTDEFKADAVAAASRPGVSMVSVALPRGINPNLLRQWVFDTEVLPARALEHAEPAAPAFVPVRLPGAAATTGEMRIDVRRASTTITVAWPMGAAAECATWIRELPR